MRRQLSSPWALGLMAGGFATGASALPDITIIGTLQSWNAGTSTPNRVDWTPEKPGSGWNNGIRWVWQEMDGMGAPVPPAIQPVFDSAVPGITGAYQFPEARAVSGVAAAWEGLATAGTSGTFELWFKPADLSGTHVLFEAGATNKGVAFALEDDELVYAVQATDGAGGNVASTIYRHTLTDTEWVQAVIVIDFVSFQVKSYFNGVEVDAQSVPASGTYRWASGNPGGLGMVGSDPAFPTAGIAADAVPIANVTDYDGQISTLRFYNVDLFASEVLQNYEALTDAAAATRRGDFNGDLVADENDKLDFLTFTDGADTSPISFVNYPFPFSPGGGVQTNDPFLDETYDGDFTWDRDNGFNPVSQEPTFQFPAANVLEPVPVLDPSMPSVRTAFVLNGAEAFRGPKFEFADDTSALHVMFWLYVDDLVGNHCLFEAGGTAVGFSMVMRGDEIAGHINTSANDGLDIVDVASGPGVLQTGWRRFDIVVRRFTGDGVGQGYELYMDGVQVAAINDLPGPDGEFGTADDINLFSPAGTGNSNFIGGNQSGYGQVQGTAALPFGWTDASVTPFNGLAGPFRMNQTQPLPAEIAASLAVDADQNVLNDRADVNRDGSADFFDTLEQLKIIDAAP